MQGTGALQPAFHTMSTKNRWGRIWKAFSLPKKKIFEKNTGWSGFLFLLSIPLLFPVLRKTDLASGLPFCTLFMQDGRYSGKDFFKLFAGRRIRSQFLTRRPKSTGSSTGFFEKCGDFWVKCRQVICDDTPYYGIIDPEIPVDDLVLQCSPVPLRDIPVLLFYRIRETNIAILARYDAEQIGIFGSYARGKASSKSDIDIPVRFAYWKSLFQIVQVEERFWRPCRYPSISLLMKAVRPYLAGPIHRDEMVIYGWHRKIRHTFTIFLTPSSISKSF